MLWYNFLNLILASLTAAQSVNETYNLTSILTGQPQLANFTDLLGLTPSLFSQIAAGNLTILAPSNEAIAEDSATIGAAINDTRAIEALFSYHVLQSIITPVQLEGGMEFVPTLLSDPRYSNITGGQRVGVSLIDGAISFESAVKATSKTITSSITYWGPKGGGIIHVIDSVLIPPIDVSATATKAELYGVIDIMVRLPENPKTNGSMGPVPDWTIFAPNSTTRSISNLSTQELFDAMDYHLAQGQVLYSPDLVNGMKIKTVGGKDVTITVLENGTTYVNDAKLIYSDYLISNGVMHVIEHDLNPDGIYIPPTGTTSQAANGTPTSKSTSPTTSTTDPSLLTEGAKAGIGIGAAAGALILLGPLTWYLRRKKPKTVSREMHVPGTEWEIDGQECYRGRLHEMQ